jgi:hypothetical protein
MPRVKMEIALHQWISPRRGICNTRFLPNRQLTNCLGAPMCQLRQSAGWPPLAAEESPGSMETRCRITSGGGDPRESATENKPPRDSRLAARVKRCGKSAPRAWQHERHGKPHREQNRIGATQGVSRLRKSLDPSLDRCPGWLLEAAGNGRPRGMAITRANKIARHTKPGLQAGWRLFGKPDYATRKIQNPELIHECGDRSGFRGP